MWEEVKEQLACLQDMIESNQMEDMNIFFDNVEWEWEYSHKSIEEMRSEFMKEAEKYLNEVAKDKYVVLHSGWCIYVFTKKYYEEKYLLYLNKKEYLR